MISLAYGCLALALNFSAVSSYDPLQISQDFSPKILQLTVLDTERQRTIPVRVYLPKAATPSPVVLFSHGLGGNNNGSKFLGNHWTARGYVCVYVQHPGSDDSVWRRASLGTRMEAMRSAASGENYQLRVKDIPAVINELVKLNKTSTSPIFGRLDLTKIGMSGHSFGAVTTQAVSGQSLGPAGPRNTDSRIRAAICFSPSPPSIGSLSVAFGSVKIPWMLMTGTDDNSPIGNTDAKDRTLVYPNLPNSNPKFELVLEGAQHSIFTDGRLPGEANQPNPNHHRAILALSTAFWDAFLLHNPAAEKWLKSDSVRSVLEPKDSFRHN